MNCRIGAESPRGVETKIADVSGENARGATRASELNVQQTGDAAADYENSLTSAGSREALRAHDACQRFDERPFVETHRVRDTQCAKLDVDLRYPNVFGKTT